jgi:hypothetical protein
MVFNLVLNSTNICQELSMNFDNFRKPFMGRVRVHENHTFVVFKKGWLCSK